MTTLALQQVSSETPTAKVSEAPVVRSSAPENTNDFNDAVRVNLSAEAYTAIAKEEKSEKKEKKDYKEVEQEDLSKLASKLEDTFNAVAVQFQVSIAGDSGVHDVRFRVIERETGKVILEFPPETAKAVVRQQDPTGALIDQSI